MSHEAKELYELRKVVGQLRRDLDGISAALYFIFAAIMFHACFGK